MDHAKVHFCIPVSKANFTDHHTAHKIMECDHDMIKGFRDSVLVCKMYDSVIRKNFEHSHSFPSSYASDYGTVNRLDGYQ